ncbi:MAG: DUF4230 domain-containing protein [Sandaracinaceae bacterium]|nr:DUF4230 domain-containing protein [Sandaracinaceae bacterium]
MSELDAPEDAPLAERPAPAMGPLLRGSATVLFILVASCIGGGLVGWVRGLLTPEPVPDEVVAVRPTPSVVLAVRELARLETTAFHVERVIDMTATQRRLFGLIEAEDSILLVAVADVVAGVDLSRVSERDVVIEGGRVTITLPAPEIFTVALDGQRTYVYRRDTDALARRNESLETRARREAERTLRAAALEAGIEERARQGAERSLGALVRALGYAEVELRFREPAPEAPAAAR